MRNKYEDKYIQVNHLLASIEHGNPGIWECKGEWYDPKSAGFTRKALRDIISKLPASDVRPVRYGRWIFNKDGSGSCSECGRIDSNAWFMLDSWKNYCSCCGADMREYIAIDENGKLIKNPKWEGQK